MKIRQISIVLGLAIIVGGVMLNKYMASLKKDPEKKPQVERQAIVDFIKFKKDTVPVEIEVTGRLLARNSIQVISEVQGKYRVGSKQFREGQRFQKGETMISIAPAEMTMNLMAQKSSFLNALIQLIPDIKIDFKSAAPEWEDYINSFEVEAPLEELPSISDNKLKLFLNSRNIFTSFYNLKALEITLSKYQIQAPFSGIVSASMINPGTLVRPGQVLGTFINSDEFELECALPESDLNLVKLGDELIAKLPETGKKLSGKIVRIANYIDPNTQTAKVFASLSNPGLKEGMYVDAVIQSAPIPNAIKVSRKLLLDDQHLYLIVDDKLKLKEVELYRMGPKDAIVGGLNEGDVLLNQSMSGAYEGMSVKLK